MKRIASSSLALVLVVAALAGCGGSSAGQAQTPASGGNQPAPAGNARLEAVKKAGKLVIGTSADYPPFESLDASKNIVGFDIDLTGEVAKELGVKLEIKNMQFDGLIPAVLSSQIDIVVAGLTITDKRKENVDFTTPYMAGNNVIVVYKDTTGISKLEDLKGKAVTVQLGSAQEGIAKKVEGANVKSFPLYTDAAQAVANKQADALIVHAVVAKAFTEQMPLKVVAQLDPVDTGMALRKGDELTKAVNDALKTITDDGRMKKLVDKWFAGK